MMAVQNPHPSQETPADVRLRELEAENARLKSLIGELLVTNQQLRAQQLHAKDSQ